MKGNFISSVAESRYQRIEHGISIRIINVVVAADLALECAEPVALPSGTYLRKPLAKKNFYEQRYKNNKPRSLNKGTVARRPHSVNRLAVWAPKTLDPQRRVETVKIPTDITVTPEPYAIAGGAPSRPGPWVFFSLAK